MAPKIVWQGIVSAVQPRIRLMRSFDQRHHSYLGFVLALEGTIGGEIKRFSIAIGKAAHSKFQFHVGMEASGEGVPVEDSRMETAELYKVSKTKILDTPAPEGTRTPPWLGIPPDLPVYRERGHRRLDVRTYARRCTTCIWGCRMAVEMIIDQWKPDVKKYRFETFCYGPKSCSFYRPGKCRVVPGRNGMSWTEEDWIDEEATFHRGPDE